MKTIIGLIIASMLVSATPVAAQPIRLAPLAQGGEAVIWKDVATAIPLGSRVKVESLSGKRYTGALMRADKDGILVKRNTRVPEPAVSIPYAEIGKLERDTTGSGGGINVGKAIGIGLAAGGAVVLSLFLIALATFED